MHVSKYYTCCYYSVDLSLPNPDGYRRKGCNADSCCRSKSKRALAEDHCSKRLCLLWGSRSWPVGQIYLLLLLLKMMRRKMSPSLLWYQGWGLTDGTQNFETSWMNTVRNHGSIPLITWEPWLYTKGVNQPKFALRNIINGNFDSYIKKWANASKAWGHPYFLRFAEEMNGNWFPWSEQVNGNKPGQYIKAWKHVYNIFKNAGVTNVTWVWSPNIEYNGSTSLTELYPGDGYVNWLGMDGYNWGTSQPGKTWQPFAQVFTQTYNDILAISTKPLMIAETASTELSGNKANWITDAYSVQIPSIFPQIKAICWFNENKETDWRHRVFCGSPKRFCLGDTIQCVYVQQLWVVECYSYSDSVRWFISLSLPLRTC